MKRATLILLFITLSVLLWPGYSEGSLKLFVDDSEVALQHPLQMINGNYMIPIWVLEEYLGAETRFSSTDGQIELMFPDQIILMQLNEESAQIGEQSYKLDVAPQIQQGEVLIPVRFIANQRNLKIIFVQEIMGLVLQQTQPMPSALGTAEQVDEPQEPEPNKPPAGIVIHEPELEEQDLRDIIFMGGSRSRVFIDVDSYTGYQTNLLTNPDRLVIDLLGVNGAALSPLEVDDPILIQVRSSRFDDQTMRIVCDLKNSTGYRITPWPDGGLEIEFNYRLTSLSLEQVNGQDYLRIQSTDVPAIEVVYLEEPLRLVLDLHDTTLLGGSIDQKVKHERIQRLRVSQHLPSITRVVLELTKPVAPLPVIEEGSGEFLLPLFAGTLAEADKYLVQSVSQKEDGDVEAVTQKPLKEGTLSGLIIAVDPGHGGSDPGTIGHQGTFEKDVALAISLYLGDILAKNGAKVVYTRDKDEYVSIFERPAIATKAGAHLFVSVHVNSHLERGVARGTETLYRAKDPVSERLARIVQDELVEAITLIDRRIWGRDDLAVFNGSTIPAILVEVGFLDHPDEEVLLRAPGFQKIAAEGIFKGIERFYLETKR